MDERPLRVLLVDDDQDDYLLTRELFSEMSGGRYQLDWMADYDEALAAICSGTYDVYLLDYRLGRRDGLELLREAAAKSCKGPAIILTGQDERGVDVAAMEAGAADFLDKGRLDAALLERSIRYALQHKRNEEDLETRVEERTAELGRANAALKEADLRKNEFLAMLAHELRGPLAPIRNALQILRLNGGDPETVRASEMMERQVAQMVSLVDDLLDVSRVSRGKIELRTKRIELAPVVSHAVEAARPFLEARNLDLTVTLPPQPLFLNADATRITQVIGNLLHNACNFSDAGGRIWLTVERRDEQAVIRVRDTGIGIAAEELTRIFDLFMQVDTSLERSSSGLGIGLTLAKTLVEMHGGMLEAQSAGLGQGSEFIVRLPLAFGAPPEAPEPPGADPALAHRRILVVDDNRDAADSLAMVLQLTGHEVRTADDGLEAVAAAASFLPDVVLLDIGLPKVNGYEAARRIREQPWGKKMMLVALTGWGQDEDRQKSEAAGFDAHMVKPLDHAALMSLLASWRAAEDR